MDNLRFILNRRLLILSVVVVLILTIYQQAMAQDSNRFIQKIALPSGQTVVVAEGDFEARSIGSFSIRLYEKAPPIDSTTFHLAGLIYNRDGVVTDVELVDIDSDGMLDIIVHIQSVGTGAYLFAYGFSYSKNDLSLLSFVEWLEPKADVISALKEAMSTK